MDAPISPGVVKKRESFKANEFTQIIKSTPSFFLVRRGDCCQRFEYLKSTELARERMAVYFQKEARSCVHK